MAKTSFVLHLDSLSILDEMPDEMVGQFLKILYKYKLNGELPKMDFAMKIAVTPFINQFVRDDEKYSTTVEKRALAGSLGGKQKLANASKSKQDVANVANLAESDSVSDSVNESVSVKEKEKDINTDASLIFERFRILFPGTKRGLQTEFKTFQKHKDWKAELSKLEPAIQNEIEVRQNKKKSGGFVPEWPMLSTYLNQRRWEVVEQPLTTEVPKKKSHPFEGAEHRHIQLKFNDYNEYLDYCAQYKLTPIPQAY